MAGKRGKVSFMALEDKIEKNPAEGSLDENAAQQQAEQTPQAGG